MERQFKFEILDSKKENKVISENETKSIFFGEIHSRVFSIYEKAEGSDVLKNIEDGTYSLDDNFVIKDTISVINNNSLDVGGAREYVVKLEINGQLKHLEDEYKIILEQKFKELELDDSQLYAIYNWDHEFNVFDKDEEKIEGDTRLKSSFEGSFIREGQPSK